ncbi:MAG: PhoU domain-containing protein [Acidimicrobiales bacterium]
MSVSPHDDRSSVDTRLQQRLRETVDRLGREFSDQFTVDTLEHYVQDSYSELARKSRALTRLPEFVERFAFDRLRALAKTTEEPAALSPDVLFVCQRNDGASQMAAALFNRASGGRAFAQSAGREPADKMAAVVVAVMHEIGIEMSGQFPKPVTPEIEAASDIIITMDAHDDVAVVEGKHFEAWRLSHPVTGDIESFRSLRDEISERIDELIARIIPTGVRTGSVSFNLDLNELHSALSKMTRRVVELAQRLGPAVLDSDRLALEMLIEDDAAVDAMDAELTSHVFELIALRQPDTRDLRAILSVHDTSLHLERIADCVVDAALAALGEGVRLPEAVGEMASRVAESTDLAMEVFQEGTIDRAHEVEQQVKVLEGERQQLLLELMDSSTTTDRSSALGADQAALALKRAGEHALDIVEQALFAATGQRSELGRS